MEYRRMKMDNQNNKNDDNKNKGDDAADGEQTDDHMENGFRSHADGV